MCRSRACSFDETVWARSVPDRRGDGHALIREHPAEAQYCTFEGQAHMVRAKAQVPTLVEEFFKP
jgi:hypothetical protein